MEFNINKLQSGLKYSNGKLNENRAEDIADMIIDYLRPDRDEPGMNLEAEIEDTLANLDQFENADEYANLTRAEKSEIYDICLDALSY